MLMVTGVISRVSVVELRKVAMVLMVIIRHIILASCALKPSAERRWVLNRIDLPPFLHARNPKPQDFLETTSCGFCHFCLPGRRVW